MYSFNKYSWSPPLGILRDQDKVPDLRELIFWSGREKRNRFICDMTGGNKIKQGKGIEKHRWKRGRGFLCRQVRESLCDMGTFGQKQKIARAEHADLWRLTAGDRTKQKPCSGPTQPYQPGVPPGTR